MARKRTVGMTVRLTVEEHERYTTVADQMGFKHFSDFMRDVLQTTVSDEDLLQHTRSVVADNKNLLGEIDNLKRVVNSHMEVAEQQRKRIEGLEETKQHYMDEAERFTRRVETLQNNLERTEQRLRNVTKLANRSLFRIFWSRVFKKKG